MNPSLKCLLILIISLEISFVGKLSINLGLIFFAIIYLLIHKTNLRTLILLLLIPLIAAFTVFATLYWFTSHPDRLAAWILASRIYVYVLLVACVSKTTTANELARSLEQNLHFSSKFCYGVLAALNILPKIKSTVLQIRTSAMMRGIYLSFWSPVLYFKAILFALSSAENLAQGMQSHGYKENSPRSAIIKITLTWRDWTWFWISLLAFNFALIFAYCI